MKTNDYIILGGILAVVYYFFMKKKEEVKASFGQAWDKWDEDEGNRKEQELLDRNVEPGVLPSRFVGGMPVWDDLMAEGKSLVESVQSGEITAEKLSEHQECTVQYYSTVLLLEKFEKDEQPTTTTDWRDRPPKTRKEFFAKCIKQNREYRENPENNYMGLLRTRLATRLASGGEDKCCNPPKCYRSGCMGAPCCDRVTEESSEYKEIPSPNLKLSHEPLGLAQITFGPDS